MKKLGWSTELIFFDRISVGGAGYDDWSHY